MIKFLFYLNCFILISCANSPFKEYTDNLPLDESINASLLNYELFAAELEKNLNAKQYFKAISNGLKFFEVFENSSDIGIINDYLHQAIKQMVKANDIAPLMALSQEQKKSLYLFDLDKGVTYSNDFLNLQLKERVGYAIEMKAAEELYLTSFYDEHKNDGEKYKIIEFFYRRFPNSSKINDYLQKNVSKEWLKKLSPQKRRKLEDWSAHIAIYQFSREVVGYSYLKGNFITLRNKTNYLFSRKLYSFDSWEEVELLKTKELCLSNGWVNVRYGEHIGFIKSKYLHNLPLVTEDKELFREAHKAYLKKEFLLGAELAAKCIRKVKSLPIKERAILLLEHCHLEIAKRTTSKNNPFLNYVLKYPKYFEITEDGINLKTSLFLFDFLKDINDNSVFLVCFFKMEN